MSWTRLRAAELVARAEGWEELRQASDLFPEWHVPRSRMAALAMEAAAAGAPPPSGFGPTGAGPGWREIAELELRAARARHPTSARLALHLARHLASDPRGGRAAEVEKLLREAESLAPRSVGVNSEAAAIWRLIGNAEEAERSADLAWAVNHENGEPLPEGAR